VAIRSPGFLEVPAGVGAARREPGAADFTVAAEPPTVDFAFHRDLGPDAVHRRLWSSWGDIAMAGDGRVYCAIGDHGNDAGGDARCFLYVWEPAQKTLTQIIDMNRVVAAQPGQPAWSKVHAKIDEGRDGKIYFSCTLNDGNRAGAPQFHWTDQLPGGQLYQYDPATDRTAVFANLPSRRCTATSRLDRDRHVWWCNLEVGGNALWCLDLATRKPLFQASDGSMGFNRSFALGRDGSVYFNGPDRLMKYDRVAARIVPTQSSFGDSPGMRSATRESADGCIYGTTHGTGQLFRYRTAADELTLLGPAWLKGEYVTVVELSADERFLYYLPGAHGGAFRSGTPVVQYELATGRRKVLAFLATVFGPEIGYVPAGTYGMKLSGDDRTLYVNFNGHAADRLRPQSHKPNGFGLCGFAALHIPPTER
jgi:hypothetical protein